MRRRQSKASPGGEVAACRETSGLTRAEFVKRAAGGGAGLLLGSGAAGAYGLVAAADATAAAAPGGVQVFKSEPKLRPPQIDGRAPATGRQRRRLHLHRPVVGPGQRGALIFDDNGEVVWFHPSTPKTAMNFRTAIYKEQPVLTWWEGKSSNGLGVGEHVIVDNSYREIARFAAGDDRKSGPARVPHHRTQHRPRHELRDADRWTSRASAAPTSAPVVGGIVQEIEIPSARVLFEWRSLDHVPIEEIARDHEQRRFFDYFHLNSIDIDGDGNLLVSARNTWAVYKIGRKTGEVIWRLGGKKSDFAMGKGTIFAWQHDARHHKGGTQITVFDDGGAPTVQPQSRALLIALDTEAPHGDARPGVLPPSRGG